MKKEQAITERMREDPFSGIRFTWLMAVQTWVKDRIEALELGVEDIIVDVWEKAAEKSLTEGEIRAMGEEAVRALSAPRGFYF